MHSWQDFVIAAGSLVLAAALIPAILNEHKPPLWTSVPIGCVLSTFAITYSTLHLWYATFTTTLTAILWAVLAIQRIILKH